MASTATPGAPRLLLVAFTPFPAATGLATRLAQRVVALSSAGYALEILTPRTAKLPHVSALGSARIFRVPMPGQGPPSASNPRGQAGPVGPLERRAAFERAVRRQLQSYEYAAIHAMDSSAATAVINHRDEALLIYETGAEAPPGADEDVLAELAELHEKLLDEADAIIVPSENAARGVTTDGDGDDSPVVLRPCADLDLYRPASERHEWSAHTVHAAVIAGRLPASEIAFLSDALRQVPATCPVRTAISSEVDEADIQRVTNDDMLKRRLTFREAAFYDDLVPLYGECEIGIGTCAGTHEQPRPRLQAIAEMMASGMAIILPDVEEAREIAKPGVEAMFVPMGDPAALAEAIDTLARDGALRERLGSFARARAEQELGESRAAARLVALYESLLLGSREGAETAPESDRVPQPRQKIESLLRGVSSTSGQAQKSHPDATPSQRGPRPIKLPISSEDITIPEAELPKGFDSSPGAKRT